MPISSLKAVKGRCEKPRTAPAAPAAAAFALAIHPLGKPACPLLEVTCDLPGTDPASLEVFDVMGRRVARQVFAVPAPGTRSFGASAGASLEPGAYWVRLTQGPRHTTSMVVAAK